MKHEAPFDVRFCILSTVMPLSFLIQERARLFDGIARADDYAKQRGWEWDDCGGHFFDTDGMITPAIEEFEHDEALRQYGISFKELQQRTYSLDVLDYLCNKEQFRRPLRLGSLPCSVVAVERQPAPSLRREGKTARRVAIAMSELRK